MRFPGIIALLLVPASLARAGGAADCGVINRQWTAVFAYDDLCVKAKNALEAQQAGERPERWKHFFLPKGERVRILRVEDFVARRDVTPRTADGSEVTLWGPPQHRETKVRAALVEVADGERKGRRGWVVRERIDPPGP